MRVDIGELELHVHARGPADGRGLVLLHGGPGLDGSVWFPGLDALADDGWRLLALDHRGNGRSERGDPARWTVPQMADDVQAVIDVLALDAPIVIGWSFGSFVAQAHMVRHGGAAGYVLMGTVAEPGALSRIQGELARFEPEHLRAQVAASWAAEATVRTREECRRLMADQMPFHLADPSSLLVAQLVGEDRVVYSPEVLRHFAAGGEYGMQDLREQLRACHVPTLILSGERDRTTPADSARELLEYLPHAHEALVADAAHMLLYEQPEATLAALRDFLADR